MRKGMGKRIFAGLLAIFMVLFADLNSAELVFAAVQGIGNITSQINLEGEYAQPEDNRTSSKEGIQLNLGLQRIVDAQNYAFANATISGEDIRSLFVYFPDKAESGDSITLPTNAKFTTITDTVDYKIISVAEGTTTEEVEDYIQAIKFTIGGSEKEISIVASKSVVDRTTYYNYENRHFYQYVSTESNWIPAYNAAQNTTFLGRQGYLVSLTTAAEETYIVDKFRASGWIGGTRMVQKSNGTFDEKRILNSSEVAAVDKNGWYWMAGPDKGTCFYRQAASNFQPYSSYSGFLAIVMYELDCLQTYYKGAIFSTHSNWSLDGWSTETQPKLLTTTTVGNCVYMKLDGGSETGAYWFSEYGHEKTHGHYVEFGDQTIGDSTENTKNGHSAIIYKMKKENTPYVSIDFVEETIKGFNPEKIYEINDEIYTVEDFGTEGVVAIKDEWFGVYLDIVVLGDGAYTAESEKFVLKVPGRAGTPTSVTGSNRTLKGLSTNMEYRKQGDTEWIKIKATKMQKMPVGMYEVRVSATNTSFKSNIATVEVTEGGAKLSVNVNKKVDVALAVGGTSVDYSNFENDLKNYISENYSAMDLDDLNIMATDAVDTSGKSSFEWLQFDHSNTTSSSAFIDKISGETDNAYNNKANHISSTENGTKLTFYGYGSSPYADFMLLENDMETRKTFQFAIKEYFAADALYGTGFFFNCNMTYDTSLYADKEAAYKAGKLYMSGYLFVLEYTGNAASGINIYRFEDLNLNTFHNTEKDSGKSSISSALQAALKKNDTNTFEVLSLAYNNNALYKVNSADDLRKFRIEVTPTKVNVFYAGFNDENHAVSSITQESSAKDFDINSVGYQAFSKMGYAEGVDGNPGLLDCDENGNYKYLLASAELPERYKGSDFGPMTKYGDHDCGSLTKVELSDLSMTMDVVRSLSETLREPKWQDNTDKFLINLNEDPIHDFGNVAITAELLNRLQNDDIYYIGWCSETNVDDSDEFLQKNNLKGVIVNIDEVDSQGEKKTYDQQIAMIAEAIYTRYADSTSDENIVPIEVEKEIIIADAEVVNTADEDFPLGKWRIEYYSDFAATQLVSSQYMSDFACELDKVGVYKFYYMDGEQPIKTVTVHTTPTASISSAVVVDETTKVASANLTADVFDSDLNKGENFTYKWSYKDLSATTTKTRTTGDLGTGRTAIISNLIDGHVYLVTLEATDVFGTTVTITRQITYNAAKPEELPPPTAFFSLSKTMIVTNSGAVAIDVFDTSYDPAGAEITGRTYKLYSSTDEAGTAVSLTNGQFIVAQNLPSGEYALGLTVTSENGTSTEVKRFFTVVKDEVAPSVSTETPDGELPYNVEKIKFTFNDNKDGSGFKAFRYCVTNSTVTPTEDMWSNWSQVASKEITFEVKNGDYYVHFQVEDIAGNVATVCKGAYKRTQVLNTPTNLKFVEQNTPVLTWTGDNRIDGTSKASYTVVIYKNGAWFAEVNGITTPSYNAANIVRGGDGTYTFKVVALGDGNTASTQAVALYDSAVSALSSGYVYVTPELPVVAGGALNIGADINTGKKVITQEDVDKVFGGFATLDSTDPVTITLNSDVKLDDSIVLSDDIVINMNGHDIIGPDGTADSPDGKPAIKVNGNDVNIDINGSGSITGGNGASGEVGGDGANAIDFGNTTGGSVEVPKGVTILGGHGGNSTEGVGGYGGNGISGSDVDVDSKGIICGGNGGNGATAGGNGGAGIANGTGDIKLSDKAKVDGGDGGNGPVGGDGGHGIVSEGGNTHIGENVHVFGGDGGNGTTGNGGNGGDAVNASNNSTVTNIGTLAGGDGGSSQKAAGGAGGNAIASDNSKVNNYSENMNVGAGGAGAVTGAAGVLQQKDNIAPGGIFDPAVDMSVFQGTNEEAIKAAAQQMQEEVDEVFGPGNAVYNPIDNTIILVNDVELKQPITIKGDVNIDLNGHTLTGPSGTKDSPDGKPAILVGSPATAGEEVDVVIKNSQPQAGGAILGGAGYDSTDDATLPSSAGGNGGSAVDFGDTPSSFTVQDDVTVAGGAGGDSKHGVAGNGGNAVEGSDVDVEATNAKLTGGAGGNGGSSGGNGGNAIEAGAGKVTLNNSSAVGGNGGNGDISGNGGSAIIVDGEGNDDVNVSGANSQVAGGNAGTPIHGEPGVAGDTIVSETVAPGGVISSPITQEMVDEVFGPGNATYDSTTKTITFNKDFALLGSVEIKTDVNIDINGHDIVGPNGTKESPDAPPVFDVTNNNVDLVLKDSAKTGSITGGTGFATAGTKGGKGGSVVDFGTTSGGTLKIEKGVTAVGGTGGYSTNADGGDGGSVVSGQNTTSPANVTIAGTITSGAGGNSTNANGGNGGVIFEGSGLNVTISDSGVVQPGKGGENVKGTGARGEVGSLATNPNKVTFSDKVAPAGKIIAPDRFVWEELNADLTFGDVYVKLNQEVVLEAEDAGCGLKSVQYAIFTTEQSIDEIRAYEGWKTYEDAFVLKGEDKDHVVIYARFEDMAGNVSYISSVGLTILGTVPVIEGTDNYAVLEEDITITVDTVTTEKVTVNGEEVTFDADGNIQISEPGKYEIEVTDKVGNTTTYDIRILGEDDKVGLREEPIIKEETYIHGVGDITVEVENESTILMEVVVDNAKNVIESILSEEQLESVTKGECFDVKIVLEEESDKITNADKQAINKVLVDHETYEELETLVYIDISVMYTSDGVEWNQVSETSDEIMFTYTIPEEFFDNTAKFFIARCHNGVVTLLEDLDNVANTITFKSSLYSTYSLVREPEVKSYEFAAEAWLENHKEILSATKVSAKDKEAVLKALEEFNELPEKAKNLLQKEKQNLDEKLAVVEFIEKYNEIISKDTITEEDKAILKELYKDYLNLSDSMKEFIDLDLKQLINEKIEIVAPKTGDTSNMTVYLMLTMLGVAMCLYAGKKRENTMNL